MANDKKKQAKPASSSDSSDSSDSDVPVQKGKVAAVRTQAREPWGVGVGGVKVSHTVAGVGGHCIAPQWCSCACLEL
jgi:hypothetical protein